MRWLVLSTVVLAACVDVEPVATIGQPIIDGALDSGDPAVAALVDESGRVVCTGTLIAPHVVLTAAHCGIDATSYRRFHAAFGPNASAATPIAISDARVHPAFDPRTFENDVALLTLRLPGDATPIPLPTTGDVASLAGASVRIVGYGVTDATKLDTGAKRQGKAKIDAVAATSFHVAPDPAQPCAGDSGGPTLLSISGHDVVVGVASNGDVACTKGTTNTRVDAFLDAFVRPYLAHSAPGTAQEGAPCLYAEHCAIGACVTAEDEPTITYCSSPCTDDAACRGGMKCTGGRCRQPLPTAGAPGSTCTTDADCVLAECPASHVCTRRCNPVAPNCPPSFDCLNTSGIRFDCVARPKTDPVIRASGSGCAAAGAHDASWLLLSLLVLAARRREARP